LNKARDKAKSIKCAGNEKQMGLAMGMYTQDKNDYLPTLRENGGTQQPFWNQELNAYISNEDIFRCPSNTVKIADPFFSDGEASQNQMHYGWNYENLGHHRVSSICKYVKIIKIKNTARTIAISDSENSSNPSQGSYYIKISDRVGQIHNSGANTTFADGHVKWYNKAELIGNPGWWTID